MPNARRAGTRAPNEHTERTTAPTLIDCPPLPPGYRVYPPRVNIFSEAVERHAADQPDARAMIWDDGHYTYAELKLAVDRAAAGYAALGTESWRRFVAA